MSTELADTILAVAALASFLAVFIGILALGWKDESLQEKLKRFTAWREPNSTNRGNNGLRAFLSLGARITPARWTAGIDRQLQRGGIPLKGGEFVVLQGCLTILLFVCGFVFSYNILIGLAVSFLGIIVPYLWLKSMQKKKTQQFNNQLADALLILANSLRAGFSLLQAMEMVSQEMADPIAGEFRLTLREMTYGTTTEKALTQLAERIASEDLDLMVTAVIIQRQVGGNLAEVLLNIHLTIQERLRIQQEIKTLTAQARTSGYIIAALPFGIAIVLLFINPSYLKILFVTPIGLVMLVGGLISQIIGFLVIRKIISIRI